MEKAMSTYAVKFNPGGYGARVYTDPASFPEGALVSPNISNVVGKESPSFWKLDNGQIFPMTEEEKRRYHAEVHTTAPTTPQEYHTMGTIFMEKVKTLQDEIELEKEFSLKTKLAQLAHEKHLNDVKRVVERDGMNLSEMEKKIEKLEKNLHKIGVFVIGAAGFFLALGVLWLRK